MDNSLRVTSKKALRRNWSRASISLLVTSFCFVFFAGSASASKQVVDIIGTETGAGSLGGQFNTPYGVAINNSGAGPANQGDVYVSDSFNARVQRFGHNDNGTPTDTSDDTYPFISAWGAGVDSTQSGNDYQICGVASDCQSGLASDSNGAFNNYYPGDGAGRRAPAGIAVDQDSGQVYVVDPGNRRVNVYSGDGVFLRSFGIDVVATGPDDNGTGYEVCVAANGDVCKSGSAGSKGDVPGKITDLAKGIAISQPDGNPASGTVFVADPGTGRIYTFNLDGSSPGLIGTGVVFSGGLGNGPTSVAVDSRGIVYADQAAQRVLRYDSQDANGGGVGFLPGFIDANEGQVGGLAVEPDSDGAGPDTDVLYVQGGYPGQTGITKQYGPINAPGLTAPPTAPDDKHGTVFPLSWVTGIVIDESTQRLFVASSGTGASGPFDIYVLDEAGPPPTASLDSLSDVTSTSVVANATINPNGPPLLRYHFEYSLDGQNWNSSRDIKLGTQEAPQAIAQVVEPVGGFEPDRLYHLRLVAERSFAPKITTPELTFTTLPASPIVETTGSPLRTTVSALLQGRVDPRNAATTYHFEYGAQGPCDANACTVTEMRSVDSGEEIKLVAQRIEGLVPGTTYHYRVVADNGNPGSPVAGEDMTITTRVDEAPLSHGHLAGPPGSNRAWEQVNMPDTGGNPVGGLGEGGNGVNFSTDGNRAIFTLAGGAPGSESGSLFGFFFSERTPSGWRVKQITPPRSELGGGDWDQTATTPDLSSFASANTDFTVGEAAVWRFGPTSSPTKLFQRDANATYTRRCWASPPTGARSSQC